jgi:hypothetical protein
LDHFFSVLFDSYGQHTYKIGVVGTGVGGCIFIEVENITRINGIGFIHQIWVQEHRIQGRFAKAAHFLTLVHFQNDFLGVGMLAD